MNQHQPPPVPNGRVPVWDLVVGDMHERKDVGLERYSVHLQAFNGREPLVDAYQEMLDAAVYTRQAIEEARELRAWVVRVKQTLSMVVAVAPDCLGALDSPGRQAIRNIWARAERELSEAPVA